MHKYILSVINMDMYFICSF